MRIEIRTEANNFIAVLVYAHIPINQGWVFKALQT